MLLLLILVGIALLAGGVTVCLVELTRRWALGRGWLDRPNARSSHAVPTPRLGGLAVTPVVAAGLLAWSWALPSGPDAHSAAVVALALVALAVGIVSLIDDLRSLPAAARFPVHLAAGAIVGLLSGGIAELDAGQLGQLLVATPWSVVLATLWVAWFVNAFNFMDGIDGIAGAQALVAAVTWIALGLVDGNVALMGTGAVVAGAAAGFLVHNWAPARIFMGDAGSAPLGFLLAAVPLLVGGADLWLASLLPLWPFLFDTALTLVRRAARGERLWTAHRSHLYQRLAICGWSHQTVTALYAALAAAGGMAAWALRASPGPLAAGWPWVLVAGAVGLWATVALAERGAAAGPVETETDA